MDPEDVAEGSKRVAIRSMAQNTHTKMNCCEKIGSSLVRKIMQCKKNQL